MGKKKHKKNKLKVVDTNRSRVDYPRKAHHEEYAAEVAPHVGREVRKSNHADHEIISEESTGSISGFIGLVIAIAALFMWSVILGPVAAVIGYYAYSQGSKTLGSWAMGLGILATISYFFLSLFVR